MTTSNNQIEEIVDGRRENKFALFCPSYYYYFDRVHWIPLCQKNFITRHLTFNDIYVEVRYKTQCQ